VIALHAHLAFACLALAPALPQDPPQPAGERPPVEEIQRLEAWPVLEKDTLALVRDDIERLRKARTPEMSSEAETSLITIGAGIVPELLPTLGKERDTEALLRIERVLLAVTGAAHTRLLADWFDDKALPVRKFALRRAAGFPDPGVRKEAEAAVARVAKQADKADRDERYAAALCAASSGSLTGFDTLAEWADKKWPERGAEMRVALEGARGPEAGARAAKLLAGERASIVAGLNMLSGCGDRESAQAVKPFLDSDDHQIRVAAINALRGIVDGQGPIDKLPVFEAIEVAKQWKTRV
jgi:hypothetical protein